MWFLLLSLAAPVVLQAAPAPLDLAALLREAREANPSLASARGRLAAAGAVPSQAEAPPDPMAKVTFTNEGFDELTLGDSDNSFLALSWEQDVRSSRKRRLAGDVARGEVAVLAARVEERRRAIDARVIGAFAEMFRVDRSTAILQRTRELLDSLQQTARTRYESGEGVLENVLKAGAEASLVDVELEILKQDRAVAEASLRAALNAPGRSFGPALDLPTIGPLDHDALQSAALANAVEIQETEAMARRDEARLDLARSELKPDLKWEALYGYRGSIDPMVMGLIGVRLPLHRGDRQAQGIVQADEELRATRAEADAARLRVTAEIETLLARAERASRLATIYEESILPQARAALESSITAYGVGRVDFLTLLTDASGVLRRELDLEVQRADRLATVAALEQLTGLPLVDAARERP